jgi:hypothetical protein
MSSFVRNKHQVFVCMYVNVIYFFVLHETFVRTVFEPLAKKIHSLLFVCRKEKYSHYAIADEDFFV